MLQVVTPVSWDLKLVSMSTSKNRSIAKSPSEFEQALDHHDQQIKSKGEQKKYLVIVY